MRTPSTGPKVAILLLLLPAGGVAVILLDGLLKQRYDDSGFGSFHGFLQAKLLFVGSNHSFSVTSEGTSPSEWRWMPPSNYCYQQLDLDWNGEASEGKGHLDTRSLTLKLPDRSTNLSQSALSNLLLGSSLSTLPPEELEAVIYVHSVILDARDGRLPPPRHHPRSRKDIVHCSMCHYSLGWRFPHSLCLWGAAWTSICLWSALQCRRRERTNGAAATGAQPRSLSIPEQADPGLLSRLRDR
jgi:hypothetical protein